MLTSDPQVIIVYGIGGSGKSYHVVREYMIPALRAGYMIITNMAIYHKKISEDNYYYSDSMDDLVERMSAPSNQKKLVVLDEVMKYFNSRDYMQNKEKVTRVRDVVAQHRKYNMTIICICHHYAQLDNTFGRSSSSIIKIESMYLFPWVGWVWRIFLPRSYRYYEYGSDGGKPNSNVIIDRGMHKISKKIADCYDTYQLVGKGGSVKRKDKQVRWKRNLVMACLTVWLVWSVYGRGGYDKIKEIQNNNNALKGKIIHKVKVVIKEKLDWGYAGDIKGIPVDIVTTETLKLGANYIDHEKYDIRSR